MDGYQLPLEFKNGLLCLYCQKTTDNEQSLLPHIIMTSDVTWDPSLYHNINDNIDQFYDPFEDTPEHEYHLDQHGEYRNRTVATHTIVPEEEVFDAIEYVDLDDLVDDLIDLLHPESVSVVYKVNLTDVVKNKPNFELLPPLFGWDPIDTIQRMFDVTTHFDHGRVSDTLKQHWRSRFPACNVKRRKEPDATDTIFSDTPAVHSGVTAARILLEGNYWLLMSMV
jgi:hypothetical protein